ncbi:MAG: hypothetical protein MPN21_12010 [Thermoanaerobaculia bacterium]|nr:hypothetical protein [Thermoanaerobaculia bacterium]
MFVVYALASLFVGFLGRKRAMGFLGFLVLSLVATPMAGLVILLLTAPRYEYP